MGVNPPSSLTAIPARYGIICPDMIRFPERSIPASEFGGRDGGIAGNDPEPGDLLPVIIRKFMDGREDFWREHHAAERDRDFRDDRDIKNPLRPAHGQLDNATRLGERDCFRERPVGR